MRSSCVVLVVVFGVAGCEREPAQIRCPAGEILAAEHCRLPCERDADCPAVDACVKGLCREGARCADCGPRSGALATRCTLTEPCVVTQCEGGRADVDRDPANGCEAPCRPSGVEICDGLDNDCNGLSDDVAVGDCSCQPGTTVCEAGVTLIECDASGRVRSRRSCGALGCSAATGRCNECVPASVRCDGIELVTCGVDGTVLARDSCATGTTCNDLGYCDPVIDQCAVHPNAPDGTPCDEGAVVDGQLCNSSCVAQVCTTSPPDCSDADACTDDVCDSTSGCTHPPTDCDDQSVCTIDSCESATGCVNAPIVCDDDDPCTVDSCDAATGCVFTPVDCSATATSCRAARSCDSSGSQGNCDVEGAPISEGQGCTGCARPPCDVCEGGVCLDQLFCDGTETSPSCFLDGDCVGLYDCPATECAAPICAGAVPEHQACSYFAGSAAKCVSASCTGEVSVSISGSIGGICADNGSSANDTVTIVHRFTTDSPDGTPFLIWMRTVVDVDWARGDGYGCTLDGVTGSVSLNLTFTMDDINGGRHGECDGTLQEHWCWLALDGDADTASYDPIRLNKGSHDLECVGLMNRSTAYTGFDGIIYTTDPSFVPDDVTGSGCTDSAFEGGTCSSRNWGPNTVRDGGFCAMTPINQGGSCTGGVCNAGVCQ